MRYGRAKVRKNTKTGNLEDKIPPQLTKNRMLEKTITKAGNTFLPSNSRKNRTQRTSLPYIKGDVAVVMEGAVTVFTFGA